MGKWEDYMGKWGDLRPLENIEYKVVLFMSRNKDNTDVEGFKPRRTSFLTTKSEEELMEEFNLFLNKGVKGETSRFYISVNARDNTKIKKKLLFKLIEQDDFQLYKLQPILAGLAAEKDCAKEHKWLFDFDKVDEIALNNFINDISAIDDTVKICTKRTPNGYAVIVDHGFDTRTLMDKWKDFVEVKKDDMLCVHWDKYE